MSSQMHEPAAGPACPGCAEPLEAGDRFCGACGYDLSAAPASAGPDRPTLAIGSPVDWPSARGTDSSGVPAPVHRPGDLPGTDSGGEPLSDSGGAGGAGRLPASADRYDGPPATPGAEPRHGSGDLAGDFGLPAAVRYDDRPGAAPANAASSGDFELPAPAAAVQPPPGADPRAAGPATPPPGTKLCVACRAGHVDPDGYCENCGHAQPRERDHMEQELGSVAAVSDRGLRHHRNEDSFAVSSTALPDGSPAVVAIVCDGVSSATRPDEASLAAASAANELLLESLPRGTHPQQAMHEAIVAASEAVNALADDASSGEAPEHDPGRHQNAPACTIVGAISVGGLLVVGWVGDSRAYWVPDDRTGPAARLTEDDSWAAQMVAAGLMNEQEAYADERAHAITGWLGADAYELEPHTAAFKPDRSGVVVVCTDGLWNYAEAADDMARTVPADAADRPLHSAQVLVGHALDGGGHDNVTVAVLPFTVPQQGAGSAYNKA